MEVAVAPGKYVVAASGGVDSMVLLDVLQKMPGIELVVAHFDHGIRPDSAEDRKLVEQAAKRYKLPFFFGEGKLGAGASEEKARVARYAFLKKVQAEQGATAIVTAHHQDDALETAILNVLRGTGRKGLSSLASRPGVIRPFLHVTKDEIQKYATAQNIQWREDSTNNDEHYLRNYIRHHIMPKFDASAREKLLRHIEKAATTNSEIDELLAQNLGVQTAEQLDRAWFISLPYAVAAEVMAQWLREHEVREFDRRLINLLVVAAKTLAPGKKKDVSAAYVLEIEKEVLKLTPRALS